MQKRTVRASLSLILTVVLLISVVGCSQTPTQVEPPASVDQPTAPVEPSAPIETSVPKEPEPVDEVKEKNWIGQDSGGWYLGWPTGRDCPGTRN